MPDPVGWADLAYSVDDTVEVIRARLHGGLRPARAHCMPLPKSGGAAFRQITVPDPFDEIVFRALVGRVAEDIDDALGDEVDSYRLVQSGPGWSVRDYRYANSIRMSELAERVTAEDFGGLGTLDVREYYPSIDADRLATELVVMGADAAAAAAVRDYVRGWQQMWGVRGVPTGPEASGLLGNACLVSVDRALRDVGVSFSRYTDDYRLWLAGPGRWADARDLVIASVEELGMKVNPGKTRHLRTAHGVLRHLTNPDIDQLKLLLAEDAAAGLAAVLDTFDAEVAKQYPDPKRLKWLLGVLKNRRHTHGVTAAQQRPELLVAEPKEWAGYLKVLHGHGLLDLDWLLDVATAPVTKETAAVAYHLMAVCAAKRVGNDHGRKLGDFATDDDRTWVPVRCAAAEAWARSDGWKPTVATEAVLGLGDNHQRRALTLTLRQNPDGPAVQKALAQSGATVPECRPAVKWIEDRAYEAA